MTAMTTGGASMLNENGASILRQLENEGVEFRLIDGVIQFRPKILTRDQEARLAQYRDR